MSLYRWVDERTLEVRIRRDETFPDGQRLTAESVKQAFDEQIRWSAPHPPGTHFNIDRRTRCEVTGPYKVRFHLPEPDDLVVGKLRATHHEFTVLARPRIRLRQRRERRRPLVNY